MPVRGHRAIVIAANSDVGVLYGAFALLERIATGQRLDALSGVSAPRLRYRLLDHWDNLNRTIERGYAGFSLWDWQKLPDYLDPRYRDYARANASIGINGSVITSVNANATSLTAPWLARLRRSRRCSALRHPRLPDGPLQRADRDRRAQDGGPARSRGAAWWSAKVDEIYGSSRTSAASW
jgi:alpha-glucuronidase